jgi:hypothetical protein
MRQARIALRYALTNVLMTAAIAAVLLGNPWTWAAFVLVLVVGGLFDESLGDEASRLGNGWRHFYDFNLFLTLPLSLALVFALCLRAKSFTLLDPADLSLPTIAGNFKDLLLTDWAALPAAVACAAYFFAVASSTAAHELGHRVDNRSAILCARGLHAFSFNPSFEVYHGRYHHRNVGHFDDPSTARRWESVYGFMRRSIRDQMMLAWTHERTRLHSRGFSVFSWRSRVISCALITLAIATASLLIGGLVGLGAFVIAAIFARALHEAINYVEHFGLVRVAGSPIADRHSWDSYRMISNALHYNLPRHADHHRNGAKPFWELDVSDQAPKLPFGYETMTLIAFVPMLWRKIMDPQLAHWDIRFASEAERALVRKAKANYLNGAHDNLVVTTAEDKRPDRGGVSRAQK